MGNGFVNWEKKATFVADIKKRHEIMSNNIMDRLSALREVMKTEGLDAFVFPSTDPHNGEYVPDHWKGREFISGFNARVIFVILGRNTNFAF